MSYILYLGFINIEMVSCINSIVEILPRFFYSDIPLARGTNFYKITPLTHRFYKKDRLCPVLKEPSTKKNSVLERNNDRKF